MLRRLLLVLSVITVSLYFVGCNSNTVDGNYERLKDGRHTFVFEKSEKNKGTFVEYFDDEIKGDPYTRNEWEIIDEILICNDGEEKFKIYKDFLIRLEDGNSEPEDYDLIAPKENLFDFENSQYKFFSDGTFCVKGNTWGTLEGKYYRENNIIYMSLPWSENPEEKIPYYFIYDDHIIDAHFVYIKED